MTGIRAAQARPARQPAAPRTAAADPRGGLLVAVALLSGLGLVMVYSATATQALDRAVPLQFLRQAAGLGAGVLGALVAARIPLGVWYRVALPAWGLSVLMLLLVPFLGVEENGARRWLPLPGLGGVVQPGEFAKLASVLAVAAVLARREGRAEVSGRRLLVALAVGGLPAALLLAQPDLGSAVVIAALVGGVLLVAGARLRFLLAPALLAAAGIAAYVAVRPYAYRRWVGFIDPWASSQEQGFQLVQSFVAFGGGGLLGRGWGDGRQKLFYLPEAHTDFILSVVAEELGLAGVLVVLGAFAALLVAGMRIALHSRQRFAMLLAFGATLFLTLPALINAAVVMGLLPTKGLTLPFLSYGRSSLVVCCLAVGMLLSLARTAASEAPGSRT
jgi:cell division protein FtsW